MNLLRKNQLGDALPASIQIFAKALNMTEAQLFKAMENGELLASEVLPKVAKEFQKSANAGGAYAKALQGLRVKEANMITSLQEAGKKIFNGGFERGLASLFNTISVFIEGSGESLTKLGKVFEVLFDTINFSLKLIIPLLQVFIENIEWIIGAVVLKKIGLLITAFKKVRNATAGATTAMGVFGSSSLAALAPVATVIGTILAGLFAISEWSANKDPNVVGVMEYMRGYQIHKGRRIGIGRDAAGNLISKGDIGEESKFDRATTALSNDPTISMGTSGLLITAAKATASVFNRGVNSLSSTNTPTQTVQNIQVTNKIDARIDSEATYKDFEKRLAEATFAPTTR